ncbi:hypothetical protein [Paenibacillus lentus]|uniref:Uncharacterized protein n=1 Tax=Paenibacillus lentus TaxID=1338368 RepID=A0A3S8RXX0_9BACL|nr:hypothetical protein [Paenibacillus lentus]AZK47766.1 hypothetical protein EIM92_17690 [Paenibacillus lentus]
MFRNRHFMLGLGVGLIIGAFLLQIMNIGQGQQSKIITVEQVQQAAEKLNLKVVGEDEQLLTEEEWEAKLEQKAEEESAAGEKDQPMQPEAPESPSTPQEPQSDGGKTSDQPSTSKSEAVVPTAPKQPEATVPKAAESTEAAVVDKPEPVTVKYKIAYGDSLTAVADGLKQAGIISSSEAFIKEASKRGINTKIRTGTYSFQIGEKYSSIITKITAKPSGK